MRKCTIQAVFVALFMLPAVAFGMSPQGCGGDCKGCHSLTLKEANSLLKGIGEVKRVRNSQVRGLWELDFEKEGKKTVAYLDYGKKHVIPGPIFSIATRAPIGGSAVPQPPPATTNVASIPLSDSVVMGNAKASRKLFVFTDPDCPFCAKLHGELKKLAKLEPNLGIYVKLFPLKMHPKAYDRSRAILAGNSSKLLDAAFAGAALPAPAAGAGKGVDATIKLGQSLGISGTPTLILPDGRIMPGFRKAEEIRKLLKR